MLEAWQILFPLFTGRETEAQQGHGAVPGHVLGPSSEQLRLHV